MLSRFMTLLLLILLVITNTKKSAAQTDTVEVYSGLEISYLKSNDTVMISDRKWNVIITLLRNKQQTITDYEDLVKRYKFNLDVADQQVKGYNEVVNFMEERYFNLEKAYNFTKDRVDEMSKIVTNSLDLIRKEKRKSLIYGISTGAAGGILIGIITAAIILR